MSNIGRWFRRVDASTKWHKCESEVADRLVTRCGREMHYDRERHFEYVDQEPADSCFWCSGPKTLVVSA